MEDRSSGLKIMNLLAGMMPTELLVDTLKADISKWELNKTDDNLKKLAVSCMLITFKDIHHHSSEDKIKSISNINDQLDDVRELTKLSDRMKGN